LLLIPKTKIRRNLFRTKSLVDSETYLEQKSILGLKPYSFSTHKLSPQK
jgi:hypothetical protein